MPVEGVPQPRRFNPYLAAAWGFVAIALVLGVGSMAGIFDASRQYYDPANPDSAGSSNTFLLNLFSMGPFFFLFSVIGAFTLLTVQAVTFRRRG
ncbi:hypothetical protein H9639_14280 [Arthrobacter sp. Sa2CUA1]|uniref:Uncharacterized protein n=1 Tax=Arthrobacter gallicola TaxID=2762225 RepID=A0ABR8UVC0_9MICC|nr:hypothetical protein [Arthrobacter gallicola]MBD7996464.1 hypothetical protein [Arthrobacter gallicola]